MRSLEVFGIVPFDNAVLQLTHSVSITEDFKHSVFYFSHLAVVWISKHGINTRYWELWWEPSNWIYIYHPLHIKQINSNLDCITLANVIDRLHIRSVDKLWDLKVIKLERVFKLFKLLQLLLLIFMHPEDSACALRLNIHFIISTVFSHLSLVSLIHRRYTTLLTVGANIHVLAALCKMVLETRHQAFVQMVVVYRAEPWRYIVRLIKDFADYDPVNSYSTLAAEVHDTGVCITFFEEEMFIIKIYKFVFNLFHPFFNAFQN